VSTQQRRNVILAMAMVSLSWPCQAAQFTEITHGLNWASTDFLNELDISLNERMKVVGGPTNTLAQAGDNAGSVAYWRKFQERMVQYCTSYCATNDLTGIHWTNSLNYTLTSWVERAGLRTNGFIFRRATSWNVSVNDWTDKYDPMFLTNNAYGYVTNGDIIGPWLFDDIQKGLTALSHTYSSVQGLRNTSMTNWSHKIVSKSSSGGWGAAYAAATNSWATTPFVTNSIGSDFVVFTGDGGAEDVYYGVARRNSVGGIPITWNASEARVFSTPRLTISAKPVTYNWSLYLNSVVLNGTALSSGMSYAFDMDGKSPGISNRWRFVESSPVATNAVNIVATPIAQIETQPFFFTGGSFTNAAWDASFAPPFGQFAEGFKDSYAGWLFTWNFTFSGQP
jgi:hypothetical protein